MRKRQLKWLWKRLRELAAMQVPREEMLMKLGAARARAPTAWRLVDIAMDKAGAGWREGRYLLRTNLTENDPALLWQYYTQLVAVEEAFKNLKGDLAIRPIFHQDEHRVEAHILMCSRDCSWFGRMADWCEQDLRRLRVRTAVAFHDSCSSRESVVAATRIAA